MANQQSDNLVAFIQAVATDIKSGNNARGALANLTTTDKTNLVNAINEVQAAVSAAASSGGVSIDDANTSTTTTWSSSKVSSELAAQIATVVASAPAAFDTLKEIADWIASDETGTTAMTTAINNRVRFDDVQTLTTLQQQQACANIGVGDPTTDFLSAYNTAKA